MKKTLGNMPDPAFCLELMRRFQMPPHIVRHSLTVCGVALFLTRRLETIGRRLNPELIQASAMLHDITKRHSLNRPLDHALTGAKLLRKLGYPEVAAVVRQHVRVSGIRPAGRISEVEIVNYSDKRVVDDQVTTLADRLEYIMERYGRTTEDRERILKYSRATIRLEEELFAILPGGPSQVLDIDVRKECREPWSAIN